MEQQNNTAAFNDSAGVLPMDTGATTNGTHVEGDHTPSSNAPVKKGRGRPPKSAGPTKVNKNPDTPKRGRGRPPKAGEAIPLPIKVVSPPPKKEEAPPTNGDANKKKRGRPSKGNTPIGHTNGISKPQVQSTPVSIPKVQDNGNEATKKKRGRPSGASPTKVVVITKPSVSKEASPIKKRGRPSGPAIATKIAPIPKVTTNTDASAKKRGRPKKATGTPTADMPTTNETAAVTPTNV